MDFWHKNWLGDSIVNLLQIPTIAAQTLHCPVQWFIPNSNWSIAEAHTSAFPDVSASILQLPLSIDETDNCMVWPSSSTGHMTIAAAYSYCGPALPAVSWAKHLWKSYVPPRIATVALRLLWDRLPTELELQKRCFHIASCCSLCHSFSHGETITHLFLHCDSAKGLWTWLACVSCISSFDGYIHLEFWTYVVSQTFGPQFFLLSYWSFLKYGMLEIFPDLRAKDLI
ncbi:hypothetical protein L1049_025886 [Liquidambar formosana]|uniref:Reverse transcriptase zinc-binding domain-containing protein n=1 Tax=Liquidambar formosana TaxID=63359 RepID=A0AAP0NCM4_LIQFO